jgi:sterol desaturase/sphingolipid hydroxylase (fatty acid hydroxylase superfamily)
MSPALSVLVMASLFLTVAALERVPDLQFAPFRFFRPYFATDVAWYLVATTAAIVSTVVFRPQLSKLAIPGVASRVGDLPVLARLAIAIVVYDFVSTAVHVGMHRSEALWSIHKVHHSSLRLDWLATTRAHMFENMVRQVPAQATVFMLGMPGSMVSTTLLVFAAFALLGHSNLRVGSRLMELVFVTPRLHRLHHISATSQNNYGTILTIWDRLFGRLVSRDASPDERFGVPGQIDDYPQQFASAFRQPLSEARARRARPTPLEPARPSQMRGGGSRYGSASRLS